MMAQVMDSYRGKRKWVGVRWQEQDLQVDCQRALRGEARSPVERNAMRAAARAWEASGAER